MKTNFKIGLSILGLFLLTFLVTSENSFSDNNTTCKEAFEIEIEEEEHIETLVSLFIKNDENKGKDGFQNLNFSEIIYNQKFQPFFAPSITCLKGLDKYETGKIPFYILNCSLVIYS